MQYKRFLLAGVAAMAALMALASAPARANDVTWSVGVHAAPGVHIGATNARPYYVQPYVQSYVQPAPVYVAPQPVYVAPPPVYYVRPGPVYHTGYYYAPAPRGHWKHHHHRKHGRGHHRH